MKMQAEQLDVLISGGFYLSRVHIPCAALCAGENAGEKAAFITGQTLFVDAGASLGRL
ncbi:MAG: hypothetical protein WCF22_16265 [Candidatus Sulfotelmatobacter sp.]